MVSLELHPLGRTLHLPEGAPLQDALFEAGVEFPCGGRGRCKGCRVKVLQGQLPVTAEDEARLSPDEIKQGFRLACQARAREGLRLELLQWEGVILADSTRFDFEPQSGLGLAVDLGTTTIVMQLLDMTSGQVLGVQTAWNEQASLGADIMSRVEFGIPTKGREVLVRRIRRQIGGMIDSLFESMPERVGALRHVVLVGNTVMHHLFCDLDVAALARSPFEPVETGLKVLSAREIGWPGTEETQVRFLPCLGGFVGSDLLAGILASRIHESETVSVLLDLGTNGEIILGHRERLLCASTAAGPAFEGARISQGMRASTGAISEVHLAEGELRCHVLGGVTPRGICGSGLVDAAACGLELKRIRPSGRFTDGESLLLAEPVCLTQRDVRELQLAKGAIAAGVRILAKAFGAAIEDIGKVYLAGAFGNYINRLSARRIGLLPWEPERVESIGNSALLGAKIALFGLHQNPGSYSEICRRVHHIPLSHDRAFEDIFVEEMGFPE